MDEHQDVYREVLSSVLELMLRRNIYLDQDRTCYELKWILRNNPGAFGKNWTGGDFAQFSNSSRYFTYGRDRIVELRANYSDKACRIHIVCNVEGIKRGPYFFANDIPDYEYVWDQGVLAEHGFDLTEQGIFRFSYPDFTPDKPIT